jgi:hypothetical protein
VLCFAKETPDLLGYTSSCMNEHRPILLCDRGTKPRNLSLPKPSYPFRSGFPLPGVLPVRSNNRAGILKIIMLPLLLLLTTMLLMLLLKIIVSHHHR